MSIHPSFFRPRPPSRSKAGLPRLWLAFVALFCLPSTASLAKVATWTGDPWDVMTRERMVENADLMIDSTWTPRRTIHNYRSPTRERTTFEQGVTYRGVAYNMVYEADDWAGFLNKVNTTPGGETSYGNDCSGFISIIWQLPRRLNTRRFEEEVTGPAELAHSLGSIGGGAGVELLRGDALNRSGSHIIMFDRYYTGGVVSAEQTPGDRDTALPHPEMRRNWSWSSLSQYRPIRRNLIVDLEPPPDFLPGDWARTTPSNLNFREGPGTSHAIITGLPTGTILRILDHPDSGVRIGSHNWWHVEFFGDGRIGWVAGGFLAPSRAPEGSGWADLVVDVADPGFSASEHWLPSSASFDTQGPRQLLRNAEFVYDPATWTAEIPYAGSYRVSAWWGGTPQATPRAPYAVRHSGGITHVTKDQRHFSGRWHELGTYDFSAGEAMVRLSSWTADGVVVADSIRFLALTGPPEPGTYGRWRADVFLPSDPLGETARGPHGDPFGHGIANFKAFAFGMDVRNPDRSALPRLDKAGDGWFLVYRRLRGESEVLYLLEKSSDLSAWSPWEPEAGMIEVIPDGDSSTDTVRVRLPGQDADHPAFYRVKLRPREGN